MVDRNVVCRTIDWCAIALRLDRTRVQCPRRMATTQTPVRGAMSYAFTNVPPVRKRPVGSLRDLPCFPAREWHAIAAGSRDDDSVPDC